MKLPEKFKQYAKYYNEQDLFKKIKGFSGKLSAGALYYFLVLFYLISSKDIPTKKKLLLFAALGYFILPTDLINDFLPAIGFSDDIAFLAYTVTLVNDYISDEIREKAIKKVAKLTGREVSDNDKMTENL